METARNFSITIKWNVPFNGNSPITSYKIYYRLKSNATFQNIIDLNSSKLTYTIISLSPGLTYVVKMQAVNDIGAGRFTDLIELNTTSGKIFKTGSLLDITCGGVLFETK